MDNMELQAQGRDGTRVQSELVWDSEDTDVRRETSPSSERGRTTREEVVEKGPGIESLCPTREYRSKERCHLSSSEVLYDSENPDLCMVQVFESEVLRDV